MAEENTNTNPETTGNGNQAQNPEKTFTQAEIDKIIGERLARERDKYNGYDDLKELPDILKDFGYEGTPAEIKAVLRQQANEAKAQRELEELQKEAAQTGSNPELLAEIKALKADLADLKKERAEKKSQEEAKQKDLEAAQAQIKAFNEEYSDIDVEKLLADPKFGKFVKRSAPNLTLIEIYEDYKELVGDTEAATIAKINSNKERSTGSGRGTGNNGGTYGLNEEQIKTVDDWNRANPKMKMTYKEFADRR